MIHIVLLAQERPSTLEEAAEWVYDALSRVATDGERPWSKRRVLAGLEGGTLSRMPMDLPTHRWVYRETTGAVRTVSVHVRVGAPLDDGPRRPGVELELEGWSSQELEPALFAEAGPRFVEAARAGRFSRGWVGPRAWTRERLNVWTLVEEAPQRRLPEGVSCEPLGGGFLLKVASAPGAPLEARVREAPVWFAAVPEGPPKPVPTPEAPDAAPAPVPLPLPLPTNVDETLPVPIKVASLGLPFSGSLSAEEVTARAAAVTPPRPAGQDVNVDETVMLPKQTTAVVVGEALRERLAPKAIPVLSLDEYAELRAGLTVFGADHAPTLARFGVTEPMVAEIVRQRFASAFTRDERLRERFVARLQECVAALRAEGAK
jgi:hypothetical protein